MPITTELTERLALGTPIVLAPMANVSGGRMAAAVAAAGGLGLIGGGYGDRAWLERELDAAGNAAVGVGFITWSLARRPELLDLLLERAPKAVFLSFGDLSPFAPAIARAGIPLIAQVQNLADAKAAAAEGAAFIVAQGAEAGGHGDARGTLALVPAVVDAVQPIPVLAAGGIADGRGFAAALMLGAVGAVCGTAFYAAEESLNHPGLKSAAVAAGGDATVRSAVFDRTRGIDWPKRFTLRTLRNAFYEHWVDATDGLDDDDRRAYAAAVARGDPDTAAVMVGEAVDLVRGIEPAGRIVARLTSEAERLLRAASAYLTR